MAKIHEIPRTVFTAEQLRSEPKLPGFFDNGPVHFDERLLDGENLFNPVYALALVIKTSKGYRLLTGVRSPEEERQPNVASVITARQSHSVASKVMKQYDEYRVPILGDDRADIQQEGYHITEIDPANPVLVADYESAQVRSDALRYAFYGLIRKIRHRDSDDYPHKNRHYLNKLILSAHYWPGPTIVGTSEVGMSYDDASGGYRTGAIDTPETTIYEVNNMNVIIATLNLSKRTPNEILSILPSSNVHYSHFDLAPLDTFDSAVKHNIVDYVAPGFEERNVYTKGLDLPLYLLACANGLCIRAAAVGLTRHIKQIKKSLGDDPDDTKRIYQMPIRLDQPTQ